MESQNLRTASSYLNNLLLSRGLLRNGVPIEFARPDKAEGGMDATMAKIINLVHDFILRRDRETDTLMSLSQNLQSMRTAAAQQTQAITRLEAQNASLDRQIVLLNTQERAAKDALRTAELRTKSLKEELTRLKGTVTQIRGQCATDIRRRDGEIQRLKKHLEGRRGRDGVGGHCGIMVVAPGTSRSQAGSQQMENFVDLESPEYSLKQETTEFLTQLSQSLSDENDALIRLIRNTLATLRSLQGLSLDPHDPGRNESVTTNQEIPAIVAPPSYEDLATSVDEVLDHLRGLLTNPSFVALEEVEVREDEIIRLRQGWEKMEAQWKEAVNLMDGWQKRMVDTGDTIHLDDLRLGPNLNSGIPPAVQLKEESSSLQESAASEDIHSSRLEESFEEVEQPSSVDALDDPQSISEDPEAAVVVLPTKKVLSPRSPNARPFFSPRKTPFPCIPEENTQELRDAEAPFPIPFFSPCKPPPRSAKHASQSPPPPNPPSPSVAQKLAKAQAEADEARQSQSQGQGQDRITARSSTARRTARSKRSRRRSTLSPEELDNLLGSLGGF